MMLYRLLQLVFLAMVVGGFFDAWPIDTWWAFLPLGLSLVIGQAVGRTGPRPHARSAPREVDPPVRGRWSALNSPADKVPSHGTHAYGQTYAIDIVAEGAGGSGDADGAAGAGSAGKRSRPGFAVVWPIARRPRSFPAFDEPLYAVADGTVVHASDWRRDHLSRNSLAGYAYLLLLESAIREMCGAGWIVGNHIVLDLGDGVYAMYAHLQRGSLTVRPGDRVRAGQEMARCGNSGNSTEPHVHFQLMDGPDLDLASGVPFRWRGTGLPANGETFTADRSQADPAQADSGRIDSAQADSAQADSAQAR
ncbi:M23 family metallopeptidase [Streptomyces sp. SID14478]|nr:M23 family metallopeptidase [Streptomyces sp. SID14478]NEB81050.1 M23 family metallopeptidase [Streptomyces sp. SID14478]